LIFQNISNDTDKYILSKEPNTFCLVSKLSHVALESTGTSILEKSSTLSMIHRSRKAKIYIEKESYKWKWWKKALRIEYSLDSSSKEHLSN